MPRSSITPFVYREIRMVYGPDHHRNDPNKRNTSAYSEQTSKRCWFQGASADSYRSAASGQAGKRRVSGRPLENF